MDSIAYFNGRFLPEAEVTISIYDRGFLFGDAAYDIGRTFRQRPFKWEAHIARLDASLRYIRIELGMTPDELHRISLELLERNLERAEPGDELLIMWRVTRGVGMFWGDVGEPTMLVHMRPVPFAGFARHYTDGAALVVAATRRTPPECLDPKAKLHNKLNHFVAELEARDRDPGAFVLMLDLQGRIAECTSQNIFLVKDGRLLTPKRDHILEGISRGYVLQLAKELDIESVETDLYLFDLFSADEVFVTANSVCIGPVSSINGRRVDGPVPGPVTERLTRAWSDRVGVDLVAAALARVQQ